jgi:1-deoxy-D-xylulose-5-phosphate synthase
MTDTVKKNILETIQNPRDLRKLSVEQLETVAGEIRSLICEVISQNGGHLAPSLGVVELTLALHATHDCPEDKIVWDVGHQAYAHKILTGRRDQFCTIRTEGGLSGFPNIAESEYDAFGTGHASTAISAALGLAAARDLRGTHERIVAVVGDGSLTGGLSFEGLNNAGAARRDIMVILNDNKMAISPNVGALPKYLTDVISDQKYNRLKKDIWNLTGYIPALGTPARGILKSLERSIKAMIVPGSWFENLGFRYFGPVDGHDIGRMMQLFMQLKVFHGPILLHVYTTKGKGYGYAEQDAVRFHGTPAFERETGRSKSKSERLSYSAVFGETLCEIARDNKTICAVTAAMTDSTGLGQFAVTFPDRFFDVGIAEGHAVTYAAGMARGGMKPFVTIYSSFMQRSFDNLIHDVAIQKLPVVFCLDRAGFVGEDGPTHHGVFDLSFMRQIPGMIVMAPKDENELRDMLYFAAGYTDGPVSIRYPRGCGTAARIRKTVRAITQGVSETLLDGDRVAILAIGETVNAALEAGKQLAKENIPVMVVNMRFAHPLDKMLLDTIIGKGLPVVTVEENVISGGFGAAIMEYFSQKSAKNSITPIAIPDSFIEHAERSVLIARYGLDAQSIEITVRKVIGL